MSRPRFALLGALALCAAAPLTLHAARQDGLVVYLTFDDKGEGERSADPLLNLAPGSEFKAEKRGMGMNMAFEEGKFGQGAKLSNAGKDLNDWAISLGKLGPVYAGSFTVACWAKNERNVPTTIIANRPRGEFGTGFQISAGLGAPGRLTNESGVLAATEPGRVSGPFSGWHHRAMVVDRAAAKVTFYFDGVEQGSKSLANADVKLDGDAETFIGCNSDESDSFRGVIDEVAVWNRALAPKEIAALGSKKAPKRIPEPSTYAWMGGAALGLAALARRRRRD